MSVQSTVQEGIDEVQPDIPSSTMIAAVVGSTGFLITLFVYFGFQFVFRDLSNYQLIDAMHGTSNSLCFAGMTSSATILPLMLTIFSFARNADQEFDSWFYDRVRTIALYCCLSFITGLITLTLLSAPIGDDIQVQSVVYQILYYSIVIGVSTLVGVLVTEIVLLYYAIIHILHQLDPKQRNA